MHEHKTVIQRLAAAERHIDDLEKRLAAAEKKLKAGEKPEPKPKAAE